ncbi:MAG TPA: NAD(P)H-hydrate dehydratase [Actinomycetota bacterium]|nr:NAD(P)H-hydrate dehydratase [Actinomycetota bacterium]
MRSLASPDEMRRADEATISAGTPPEILMERAGAAVAAAVKTVVGGVYDRRCVVVCGTGNNGGDGFAAARILAEAGMAVRCTVVGETERIRGAADIHLERCRAAGVVIAPFSPDRLARADVIVDALLGTGASGAPRSDAAQAIDAINASDAPVVAADLPSGIDGATGAAAGAAVRATVTVAMGSEKTGTAVGVGAEHAGSVTVAPIGIRVGRTAGVAADPKDVADVLPSRDRATNKFGSGSVLVIAGSDRMPGAAALAARGAARAGAGYVMLGSTRTVCNIVVARAPEVVATVAADTPELGPEAIGRLAGAFERASVVALGPGLGRGASQDALVEAALGGIPVPLVLDADGLNALAAKPEAAAKRHDPLILTPHAGELARLLGWDSVSITDDPIGAVREAVERFGCTVLLKGPSTIVGTPDHTVVVRAGGPELASAGTGDVLTGVIAALVAAGTSSTEAAWAGAWLHGRAGAIARASFGPRGVVAWDVAEALPAAEALVKRRG